MAKTYFQNFDAPSPPVRGNARLSALRKFMADNEIDVVLVPHNDEQNNEYLPTSKERLAWLSGFTGSAGHALVTKDQAVLFTDGRYTLQAGEQADPDHWVVEDSTSITSAKWLIKSGKTGLRIGIDPWLHVPAQVKILKDAARTIDSDLVLLVENPIDAIWDDQPADPLEPAHVHDLEFAGKLARDKLTEVAAKLIEKEADACVLTDATSVSWLFNIRGGDVVHTPMVLAHAIVSVEGEPMLFIDKRKLDIETKAYLTQIADLHPPNRLDEELRAFAKDKAILLDPDLTPIAFNHIVEGAGGTVVESQDPVALPRAIKNDTEISGARAAHLRDGAAMSTFLAWLADQPPNTVDEIAAARQLETFRTEMASDQPLRDISFDTISGSGPHGAIVHYRVNQTTNRTLKSGELYLCDSGGQYADGTTDITRTVAIGPAGNEERRAFTLVLRGHIAIDRARFPNETRGIDLDSHARMPLWQNGMDYGHGTGHGIGSYLAVHEGPQGLSRRAMQAFKPGMIVSNEPGYYRAGAFGIRIENLLVINEPEFIEGGDVAMMSFETLTLAPIDLNLVDGSMMTEAEVTWLNEYHARVRQKLAPLVSPNVAKWLETATRAIS